MKVLALGNLGYFKPSIGTEDALGVLDLEDGSWQSLPAQTTYGHLAMPLRDGGAVLMPRYNGSIEIRGSDFASRKVLEHPAMTFSGHCIQRDKSVWLAAEPSALADDPDAPREGEAAEGYLVELNLETLAFGRVVRSGGIHPHEMVDMGGGKIAVSHYGATMAAQKGKPEIASVTMDLVAPMITVIDVDTGVADKRIVLPKDGAATHMAKGGDGRLYVMPLQYDLFPDTDALAAATADEVILRQDEWQNRRYGRPLPMRVVDLDRGVWEDIDLGPRLQRRGQSVACNQATGKVFGTFPYSDTLWCFDPKTGRATASDAFDFGIEFIRGVCDLPGTPYVAISGEWKGIAIVDARSMKGVARYPMPTLFTVHIASHQKA